MDSAINDHTFEAHLFLEENLEDACALLDPNSFKTILTILGTVLSVISAVCNILIAIVLLRPKHSHFFFLGLLALSDTFLSILYGPIIGVYTIGAKIPILWVHQLWWSFAVPLLSLCNTAASFSCFLIILASIERYLITIKSKYLLCFRELRGILATAMFIVALILRGTTYFEIRIGKNGNCTGLSEYTVEQTEFAATEQYKLFSFYVRNVTCTLIPFVLLAFLNARIVTKLREQQRSAVMFHMQSSCHKAKIRSATLLLILIVFSYLIANFLQVISCLWEYIDFDSTQTESLYPYYDGITDLVSVLCTLGCASRLFIYMFCNEEFRCAFMEFFCVKKGENYKINYEFDLQENESQKSIAEQRIGTEFDQLVVLIARQIPKFSPTTENKMADINEAEEIRI